MQSAEVWWWPAAKRNWGSAWRMEEAEGRDTKLLWDLGDHPRQQESCSLAPEELSLLSSRSDHGSVHGQAQSQGIQQTLGLIPEAALQGQKRPTLQEGTAEHPQMPPGPSCLWSLLRAPGGLALHQTVNCEAKCCWVAQIHFWKPWLLPESCTRLVERWMWRMSGQHWECLCHEARGSLPGVGTQDTFCRGCVGYLCVTKEVTFQCWTLRKNPVLTTQKNKTKFQEKLTHNKLNRSWVPAMLKTNI